MLDIKGSVIEAPLAVQNVISIDKQIALSLEQPIRKESLRAA